MDAINSQIQNILATASPGKSALQSATGLPDHQEVADSFEGVFMSLMIKQLRQTAGEEGLFAGDKSDTFGGMFDLFMGQHLSKSSDLGIGKLVSTAFERAETNERTTNPDGSGGDSIDRAVGSGSYGPSGK